MPIAPDGTRLRVAVHADFTYRISDGAITAELPFVLFFNALAEQGVDLTVLGRLGAGRTRHPFQLASDVRFGALPFYESMGTPTHTLRVTWATLRAFARETRNADVVWLFGPHPFSFLFAALAKARRQTVALGVRQDLPTYMARRRPGRPALIRAARVMERGYRLLARGCPTVVVGPDLARAYRKASRLLDLRISLVKEADIARAEEALERSYAGPLTVMSVGRLDAEKNPLLLADVLHELRKRDPRWRLEVYGVGPLEPELRARLAELGLSGHSVMRGYVPFDGGLVDAYQASHALLHVSWTEGFPQVLFEAFAAGLPVVATAVGGIPEAVSEEAILVPPGDAVTPASALARLGMDQTERERLIRAGLRAVHGMTIETQSRRAARFLAPPAGPFPLWSRGARMMGGRGE